MWGVVASSNMLSDPDEDMEQMRMCVSGWWAAQRQSLVDTRLWYNYGIYFQPLAWTRKRVWQVGTFLGTFLGSCGAAWHDAAARKQVAVQ